jgi:chemotaxis protein MotA
LCLRIRRELKVNKSTLSGIAIALCGIALGLYLDGGKVGQMLQPTAALIVFGGTLGAVIVQFPFSVVVQAVRQLSGTFTGADDSASQVIEDLMRYAARARRSGLVSLDSELDLIRDPFLKKAMTLAIDGTHSEELRKAMELEMDLESDSENRISTVFEAAGGYAPTIGIIGAVIGLIQVMQRLQNITEVGQGIAVAFVATLYGVGSANIFFLPFAGRVRIVMRRKQVLRELMLDGVIAIIERTNPKLLETKLEVYLERQPAASGLKLVTR